MRALSHLAGFLVRIGRWVRDETGTPPSHRTSPVRPAPTRAPDRWSGPASVSSGEADVVAHSVGARRRGSPRRTGPGQRSCAARPCQVPVSLATTGAYTIWWDSPQTVRAQAP